MHSPMEQFEIKRLLHLNFFGIDASFTNSSTWMIIAVILATAVFVWGMRQRALVPGRLQSVAELGYEFIAGMVRDNVGDGGKKYFPFILTLFIFILFCNVLGMVPYSFTPTSHIVVTFAMAAFVFVGVTLIGFACHGVHFLSLFVPTGVPFVLLLLLVPMAIISATIALAGVGVGIGNIFGSFVSGALRNPEAAPRVFGNVLLGFALTEAVALFALVIAFMILFVF